MHIRDFVVKTSLDAQYRDATWEVTAKVKEAVQESTEETFDYEAADADTDKAVDDVLKKSVGEMFS